MHTVAWYAIAAASVLIPIFFFLSVILFIRWIQSEQFFSFGFPIGVK